METNLKRRDYHKYLWKKGEKFRTILICIGITGILAYFFYRSLWAMIPLSAVGILAFYQFGKEKAERARGSVRGKVGMGPEEAGWRRRSGRAGRGLREV